MAERSFLHEDASTEAKQMSPSSSTQKSTKSKPFLVKFRTFRTTFRLPEMHSLSVLFNDPSFEYDPNEAAKVELPIDDPGQTPFLKIRLQSKKSARNIASRSVGIGHIYEIMGEGKSWDEVIADLKQNYPEAKMKKLCDGKSFKMILHSYGKGCKHQEQIELIKQFSFLPVFDTCPISMTAPERVFAILIDSNSSGEIRRCYFALQIAKGNSELIDMFDVKKRPFIGTTTMDSELSLFMANQALAKSGSFVWDPFVGTGSLVLTCSWFGAMTVGNDIDKRTLFEKEKSIGVVTNFQHHRILHRLVDLVISDSAHPCWRELDLFDAIVSDPPYGVREGARKVGKKAKILKKEQEQGKEVSPAESRQTGWTAHFPSCIAYRMDDLLFDLLDAAARRLRIGGRLVYWLPTTDQYKESDLPLHPCLKIVANSEQKLGLRRGRRLITMVKVTEFNEGIYSELSREHFGQVDPSHKFLADYWMKRNVPKEDDH